MDGQGGRGFHEHSIQSPRRQSFGTHVPRLGMYLAVACRPSRSTGLCPWAGPDEWKRSTATFESPRRLGPAGQVWCGVPVAAICTVRYALSRPGSCFFCPTGVRGQGLRVSSIVHVSDAYHDFPDTAGQRSHRGLIWPACILNLQNPVQGMGRSALGAAWLDLTALHGMS